MSCPENLRTQAFVDGQLNAAETRAAENHIESCAECRQLRAELTGLSEMIRRGAATHGAPPSLAARIQLALDWETKRDRQQTHIHRPSFWLGALGGTGLSALAASLLFLVLLPVSVRSLTDTVTDAHVRALMQGHTIEVVSSNHHTVKPWFAGRVPISPPVADFASDGFTLKGGRVEQIAGAQAAVVVYGHGAHEIDLFVWADRGGNLPGSGTRHGYHSEFWKNGDLDFAAVSDMQSSELERFVDLVKGERE
ncbi:MAG TPA: zf-HC2 domain-containing protein [Rhizomicrobium sp.]